MNTLCLKGTKIGVVVEHKFIPEEIEAYRTGFALLGAEVEFLSRLNYGNHRPTEVTFSSDVDPSDDLPWEGPAGLKVAGDVTTASPGDYAAIIMSANYTSVRLRYAELKPFAELTDEDIGQFEAGEHVRRAPAFGFFERAMANRHIVKGMLCHGLWILTPNKALLEGRKVICHTVVMADIVNCGAHITLTKTGVVTDGDLVTGFSKHEVVPFIAAIAEAVAKRREMANETS